MVKLDNILFEINDWGRYQRIRYYLICLAGLLPPIVTYLHSFLAANPHHRCKNPYVANDTYTASSLISDTFELQKCHIKSLEDNSTQPCNEWVYDKQYYQSTLTEEWNMVCDRAFYRSTVQTVYFFGYIVGSLVIGFLSDIFGRRPLMLSSFVLIIIGSFGVAFGPQDRFGFWTSYVLYSVSRFLIACGTRGINVTGFVLAMELVGTKHRTFAGIVFQYFFALGQILLVTVAFFARDWRTLAYIMIVPTIPFLCYTYFIHESPRWLISKKRQNEAFNILEQVAKTNKRHLNEEYWKEFLHHDEKATNESNGGRSENIFQLFKSPILLCLLCTMFFNWISNNLVFYGVGLKSNDLGVNPYLSFVISGTVELVAYIISYFLIDRLGRKIPYCFFLTLAGVSCLSVVLVDEKYVLISMSLAMLGKFAASAAYGIIHLYSTEIFPTSVRNSCMGACSMMARVGSVLSPNILLLGEILWRPLPFLIFGLTGILCAVSSVILPETNNRPLPEKLAHTEEMCTFISCFKKRFSSDDNDDDHNNGVSIRKEVNKLTNLS